MEERSGKLIPALWGGVLMGVISGVPGLNFVNCLCCAGVLAGGVFAVFMYRRQIAPQQDITTADGALLGLLAGVFGAVIGTVLSMMFGAAGLQFLQDLHRVTDDPRLLEALDQLDQYTMTGGLFFLSMITSLVVNSLFGLLGGMLGTAFFGKAKTRPEPEDTK